MPNEDQQFGENVQRLRKAAGLSQAELAYRMTEAGYPMQQQTVLKIEKGARPLKLSEASWLARVLDVTMEQVTELGYTDEELELMSLGTNLRSTYFQTAALVLKFNERLEEVRDALGERDAAEWLKGSIPNLLDTDVKDILASIVDRELARELHLPSWGIPDDDE